MLKCCLLNLREGNIIKEVAILKGCERKTLKLSITSFCYNTSCLPMVLPPSIDGCLICKVYKKLHGLTPT
jgi:hypothetical protein